ncbi:hypothetical protein CRUP_033990 [Coryphaenoides rupestris]|nr:hypothetical protein CRUP_033990 [Coryphaenoides rupestris]
MYLPSCTYYVSNPAARQPELRPVNSPFLSDSVVNSVQAAAAAAACTRDPVQGLRDYGSTWLDNTGSATKPLPDYRHYALLRAEAAAATGKWSVYHHHQTNHHHNPHRRHLAPSPSYFSPDESVFRDSALTSPSDAVLNNSSERFLGYDPAVVYGGHGAAAAAAATRYHTHSAFSDSNSVVGPFGLSVSNSKPPSVAIVPSPGGRNRILPPGFDAFIDATEEHQQRDGNKSRCSAESPETETPGGADNKDTHPGEEVCDKKTEPSDPLRAGTQGEDSPSSNEDNSKEQKSSERRKKRCPYTKQQLRELEREFLFSVYVNKERRLQLSRLLCLTDRRTTPQPSPPQLRLSAVFHSHHPLSTSTLTTRSSAHPRHQHLAHSGGLGKPLRHVVERNNDTQPHLNAQFLQLADGFRAACPLRADHSDCSPARYEDRKAQNNCYRRRRRPKAPPRGEDSRATWRK